MKKNNITKVVTSIDVGSKYFVSMVEKNYGLVYNAVSVMQHDVIALVVWHNTQTAIYYNTIQL